MGNRRLRGATLHALPRLPLLKMAVKRSLHEATLQVLLPLPPLLRMSMDCRLRRATARETRRATRQALPALVPPLRLAVNRRLRGATLHALPHPLLMRMADDLDLDLPVRGATRRATRRAMR